MKQTNDKEEIEIIPSVQLRGTLSSNIPFFLLFIYFLLYPPFGKWRWSRVWMQNITLKFLIQEVKEEERNIVLKSKKD